MSKFLEFFVLSGAILAKFFCHPITIFLIASLIYCCLQIYLACGLTRRRRSELCCQLYDQLRYKGPARTDMAGLMDEFRNLCSGLISLEYTFAYCHQDPTYRKLRIMRNILFGIFGILYIACDYAILSESLTRYLTALSNSSASTTTSGAIISIIIGVVTSVGFPLAFDLLNYYAQNAIEKFKEAKQQKRQKEIIKIFHAD